MFDIIAMQKRQPTCLPEPRKASFNFCAAALSLLVDTLSSGSSSAFSSATYGRWKRPLADPDTAPSLTSPAHTPLQELDVEMDEIGRKVITSKKSLWIPMIFEDTNTYLTSCP